MILTEATPSIVTDRTEAFRVFAEQRATGQVTTAPTLLAPEERRLYVRQTLHEDHQFRIHNRPEGAQAKFDKLAKSPFVFFRGTALLYYRDYAGTDAHLPVVLTIGDVHPENYGVMPNADGAPFFGLNDFDEAAYAPFSWDVKRGAVGFNLMLRQQQFDPKQRRKIVKAFVKGYIDGLLDFARNDREKWHQWRIDNSPPMIQDLLESAQSSRRDFLRDLIDFDKGRFVPSKKIVPHSNALSAFQKAVNAYTKTNRIETPTHHKHFRVKDVAIKTGSGTASLGLDRYFVLIDGPTEDIADDLILEFKQARQSALFGLSPNRPAASDEKAERILESHAIHVVGGDPYYGQTELNSKSFLVRERSPYKDEIEVEDLNRKDFKQYANICGQTLAQAHARSDADTGAMEGNAEEAILSAITPKVFITDVVRFAEMAADRIEADHKAFAKDHAKGAFKFI